MCCCKNREEGGTRERSGAKEESVGTTKEERAGGGNAHGEMDGRSRSETPVRARADEVQAESISRRTITERSSYLFNLTHSPHLSVAAVHAGLFRRPPHPRPPPSPKKTVTHTLTRSLEATDRAENVGGLQD